MIFIDVWILDHEFRNTYLIDSFQSIIWTESYIGYGNFELYIPINEETIKITSFVRNQRKLELDTFLYTMDSEQVMIIEAIEMSTSADNGSLTKFSGRSLESILTRRIIWVQTIFNCSLQDAIARLLNDAIISPEIADRKISNFVFKRSTDPAITALKADTQFTGDNLYDAILDLLTPLKLGFKVTLNEQFQFVFELYFGKDRSYDQTQNTYVIFSPGFDNLVTSNFLEDVTEFKTITLVAGEDEAQNRRTQTVGYGVGMKRRELFTDARDIQSVYYDDDGTEQKVPDNEYNASLIQRGSQKLEDYKFERIFEGEVEAVRMFVYGQDFYKGDIVQVETEYEIRSKMRIMQMVRTQDENGIGAYPVFEILDDENE